MGRKRWLGVVVACVVAACGSDEDLSTTNQALTGSNGVWQNSLSTNGVWQNGVWQNGVWQNGVWQNGVWQNGVWQNGVWQNGVWQNGVWQNGVWQNGVWQNGVWQNGVWQNNLAAREMLNKNPYTREVLKYIYSCAMRSDQHATLDLDDGTQVQLDGAIGLEPQWGDPDGECDETCQRWVSACVLARTNAYGTRVNISLRAPANAPQSIRDALAVTDTEATQFSHREGSFYGNLFATTPVDGDVGFINSPEFHACAGPWSNIPDITKRFMSSQGAEGVFDVTGVCEGDSNGEPAQCLEPATGNNGEGRCKTSDGREFDEVLTVYLEDPVAVCGNEVCEGGEHAGEANACPTDCHPDTAARSWDMNGQLVNVSDGAVAPDRSVVYSGMAYAASIDVGASAPLTGGIGDLVVVKYAASGRLVWAKRFTQYSVRPGVTTIAPDGSIAVLALSNNGAPAIFVARLDGTTGDMLTGWPRNYGGTAQVQVGSTHGSLGVAADGRIAIAGQFQGQATFGSLPPVTSRNWNGVIGSCCSDLDTFVAMLSPTGDPEWVDTNDEAYTAHMNLDAQGDVEYMTTLSAPAIHKLCGHTRTGGCTGGAELWTRPVPDASGWTGIATDSRGNVYATGSFRSSFDFGGGMVSRVGYGQELYLAKYDPNGNYQWLQTAAYQARPGYGLSTFAMGSTVSVDSHDNPVIAGMFTNQPLGGWVDFGAGAFDSFNYADVFVSSYTGDHQFRWAKQFPVVMDNGWTTGVSVNGADGVDEVVLSGRFGGSMNFDSQILIAKRPESSLSLSSFIGQFRAPDPRDDIPPTLDNLSQPLRLQATDSTGAKVWYMPPTAEDMGFIDVDGAHPAGVTVYCDPPPSSQFAIGTTTVTCTATDAVGNQATKTFDVTVLDRIGPVILGTPLNVKVVATSIDGAIVTFAPMSAVDQVSTASAVTCDHASGTLFAIGTTTVTCQATDAFGNVSVRTFPVVVSAPLAPPPDTTPPRLVLPDPITLEATGPDGAWVTYLATATDDVDGTLVPTCTPASPSLIGLGTASVQCSVADHAGNVASGSFPVTVVDTTAPGFGPIGDMTVPATSSAGATVDFSVVAHDIVSGTITAVCTPASHSTFPIGTSPVSCTASDSSGNSASATFNVIVTPPPDTTPPVITVPSDITVATTTTGQVVTYSATATDNVDGTDPVTCTPTSGSTFGLGTTTVTCTAHDAAGNSATKSFTVTVLSWSFFLQPINSDGSSIFKQGNTIPVKFQLTGASASITNLAATIHIQKTSNNVTGNDLEVVSSGTADSGTTFRYDPTGGIYIFNLSTTNLTAGTYMVSVSVGTSVLGGVNVSLKK